MGWVAGATHPSIATNQPAKQAKNQEQTNNCSWEKKSFDCLPLSKAQDYLLRCEDLNFCKFANFP